MVKNRGEGSYFLYFYHWNIEGVFWVKDKAEKIVKKGRIVKNKLDGSLCQKIGTI